MRITNALTGGSFAPIHHHSINPSIGSDMRQFCARCHWRMSLDSLLRPATATLFSNGESDVPTAHSGTLFGSSNTVVAAQNGDSDRTLLTRHRLGTRSVYMTQAPHKNGFRVCPQRLIRSSGRTEDTEGGNTRGAPGLRPCTLRGGGAGSP
jgi:hypothetical protein